MSELEHLRIRDEVLQAMYWMGAEGISDAPAPDELARFLAVPRDTLVVHLKRLVADGYLQSSGRGYELSASGAELGKRGFADEFAELTRPSHGECDEDCWCHDSPEEAARCLEDRVGHAHA